ncbi:MAG: amino acid adenylation domain-containing protein [Acidobacteria bacterium]|nr:amino acid adenylation domain-containing protein [Acidobacteriota bacterium]
MSGEQMAAVRPGDRLEEMVEGIYPLSPAQYGILFDCLYRRDPDHYVAQRSFVFDDLDPVFFALAWRRLFAHHPILRTGFVWEGLERPVQVVLRRVDLPLAEHDLRSLPEEERHREVAQRLQADRRAGFDFTQAPLLRLALYRLGEHTFQFACTFHHLVQDGWSQTLLVEQLVRLYGALVRGTACDLGPRHSFSAYLEWLSRQDRTQAESYWRRMLAGFDGATPLGEDGPGEMPGGERQWCEQYQLAAGTAAALRALARQNGMTPNTFLQGAWALLLGGESGRRDVVFGITVSGRPADLPGVEVTAGPFINVLPLRVRLGSREPLLTWLRELQNRQAEQRQYEYSSLVEVQGWSEVPRGQPLFASVFTFQSRPAALGPAPVASAPAGLRPQEHSSGGGAIGFSLSLEADLGSVLTLTLFADRSRFSAERTRALLQRYAQLLELLVAQPETDVDAFVARLAPQRLVGDAERRWLIHELNRTAVPGACDGLVHELFAAQARRTPSHEAVVAGDLRLTYEELDRRSNQLARYLQRQGVGSEHLVGMCVDRTPARLIGILGVLKSGAAYLPLEPAHPQERLRLILEEARPSVLLVERALRDRLPASTAGMICLEEAWAAAAGASEADLDRTATPQNLFCVLYTSGSTGSPKGVMFTHRAVCNYLFWAGQTFRLSSGDRVLHNTAFSFDVSLLELLPALVSGATLVLSRPGAQVDSGYLARLLRDERVHAAFFAPSMLRFLLQEPAVAECTDLRLLWCGGEAIPTDLRDLAVARLGAEMGNIYGPTETTINATYWACRADTPGQPVPVGKPIVNTRLFVVDDNLELVSAGVVGELLIGGMGVSRGYLRQPGRTAASFVPDPFSGEPGERLYRSGDLVRYRPDGALEYLGRKDFQVKIRGFRIELGEVETALATHPRIEQAVATVREDIPGHPRLVAYLVARGADVPSPAEMRAHLQQLLPDYMVPAVFVTLAVMPLSPNGKVDRRALPAPVEGARADLEPPYVAPRNPVEEVLCEIWSGVLGVERISVEDDFFELGGHSLLALQVLARLRGPFSIELPLAAVFDAPTVAAQAAVVTAAIQAGKGRTAPPVLPVPRGGPFPLSFAQQRLWFLDQLHPGTTAYNLPYAVRLVGPLRVAVLAGALREVVRRHEALRARFVKLADGPAQVFAAPGRLPLPLADLAGLPAAARQEELRRLAAEEARQPFDLSRGPLLRTGLLRLGAEEHALLLTLHHVAGDAWSMNLLLREVTALYQAFAAGRPSPLAELPVQYADYAVWQRGWLRGEVLEEQLAYWRSQLAGAPRELRLPTDLRRPATSSLRGASQSRPLPSALGRALKALGRREGATPFMTLNAALGVVLCHLTDQEDFVLGSNAANRSPIESEGLIGFFVNLLALRFDLTGDPGFRQLLGRVRTMTLGAYAHQGVPFETLVHELQLERRASGTPLIQAVVDFQNAAADGLPELPGLALELLPDAEEMAKFDLVFVLTDTAEGLRCTLQYRADLFYATTVAHLLDSFELCLRLATADPEIRLSALRQRLAEHDRERTAAARESLSLKRRQRSRDGKRASGPASTLEGGN